MWRDFACEAVTNGTDLAARCKRPMVESESSDPAEVYEHYLGSAIAEPWTSVLFEYAAPQQGKAYSISPAALAP